MFNDDTDDYFANLPEEEVHEALKPPPPWAEGVYNATINEAIKYQGEGKEYPCVQLKVTVTNDEGKPKVLKTWVLSKKPTALAGGLRFLRAVGLKNTEYRNPAQLVGLSAPVSLIIKKGTDEVERNEIKSFIYRRG